MTKKFDARNAEKSRAVCEAMAERADTGKRVLTERERRILDMWPRFEDGEPVMIGDEVDGLGGEIIEVYIAEDAAAIWNNFANHMHLSLGERVKRPAPKVLDADGVEIKVGDTVYGIGRTKHRFEVIDQHHIDPEVGEAFSVRCYDRDEHEQCHCKPKLLTHTRPDSWERLEEDASKEPCFYFGYEDKPCGDGAGCPANKLGNCSKLKAADIVRRAKALAGAEAGR